MNTQNHSYDCVILEFPEIVYPSSNLCMYLRCSHGEAVTIGRVNKQSFDSAKSCTSHKVTDYICQGSLPGKQPGLARMTSLQFSKLYIIVNSMWSHTTMLYIVFAACRFLLHFDSLLDLTLNTSLVRYISVTVIKECLQITCVQQSGHGDVANNISIYQTKLLATVQSNHHRKCIKVIKHSVIIIFTNLTTLCLSDSNFIPSKTNSAHPKARWMAP